MVFTEVYLVRGLLLDIPQSTKSNDEDYDQCELDWETCDMIEKAIDNVDLKVFTFPCCSEVERKVVIGINLNTVKRKQEIKKTGNRKGQFGSVSCGRVDEDGHVCDWTLCNTCLGTMEDRWLDVDKIFNEPTVVPKDDKYLYDDTKIDRLLDAAFDKIASGEVDSPLKGMELKRRSYETYYMVDDCLSCS